MRIKPASPMGDASLKRGGQQAIRDAHGGRGAAHTLPIDLNRADSGTRPRLTVIIPTRRGEPGVGELVERLGPAIEPLHGEIIVVVDGDEGSLDGLTFNAQTCPVRVRLLSLRHGGRADRSNAVIAGARHARGAWVLVINAGPQHPPEAAVLLASTAMRHDSDIVVGTRFAGSGTHQGRRSGRLLPAMATRLVKGAFPRRLAMVSDPLSGLFTFRAAAVDTERLSPAAFRILLEILVRYPATRITEVAYHAAPRHAARPPRAVGKGTSFLAHLARLRLTRLARQLRDSPRTPDSQFRQVLRMIGFGLIGVSGLAVNTAALWLFYGILGWNDLLAAALATQASTAWNFAGVATLIYRKRQGGGLRRKAMSFFAMNNLLMLARLPVIDVLVRTGTSVPIANIITLAALFVVRFVVSDRAIFGPASAGQARDPVRVLIDSRGTEGIAGAGVARHAAGTAPSRKRSQYLPYRYDVAGVVTIGSQITLPELEFFRAQWVSDSDVDIAVRVGDVGGRRPRRRAAMTEYADPTMIRYEEHLGRLGANFRASLGDRIDVEVGPLLARSSHVVYTNVIEPLLRFVMVSRGRMLLHSACVELNGTGVMMSALTDTGKTGTVLRLLREHGGKFLSDDMTVIDAEGNAWCFPKPLTISAHTLRAVRANDLTRSEWRSLQIQSRLHSKGGRSIGIALARFNLPIMGINALTQILIPPPKYTVDRLVPCRLTSATRVRELFIIERGTPRLADLDSRDALEQLIVNTDDAYGFPPFRYLAPAISIGGQTYQQLRRTEREILAGFLSHLRVRTLASNTFSWADEIPGLIEPDQHAPAAASYLPPGPQQMRAGIWPSWSKPSVPGRYL